MANLTVGNAVFKFMANGGAIEMNVDGSSTPVKFSYSPPADKVALIERINFVGVDSNMGYEEFMGLGVALTNGIEIKIEDDDGNDALDFLDGQTIKVNEDFSALAGPDNPLSGGANAESMPVRWTISRAGGPFLLQEGYSLVITINDNLTAVNKFRAMIQGMTRNA